MNAKKSAGDSKVPKEALPCEFYAAGQTYLPEDSIAHLMRRISVLFVQSVERELEPCGLTDAQWVPLYKLHAGRASTVAELARECHVDAGSMTRMLDRLEARELCRRVRSSDDRRVVNLELTDAGRSAAEKIPAILRRVQNAQLNGFSIEEWENLKSYLRRILNTAQTLSASEVKNDK